MKPSARAHGVRPPLRPVAQNLVYQVHSHLPVSFVGAILCAHADRSKSEYGHGRDGTISNKSQVPNLLTKWMKSVAESRSLRSAGALARRSPIRGLSSAAIMG